MSLNKVILMGNLVRDPEIKQLSSGTAVVSFSLAVSEKYKKANGEMADETSFLDVEMFGKRAELVHKFFTKGKPIIIEGKIKQRRWEDKDGSKKSKVSIMADTFEFLPVAKSDSSCSYGKNNDINDDIPF